MRIQRAKHLGLTQKEFRTYLFSLFLESKDITTVASILKVSKNTLYRWCRFFAISFSDHGRRVSAGHHKAPIVISEEQFKILDGLLLGDGYLGHDSTKSSMYAHTSKYTETLYKISNDLSCLSFRRINKNNLGSWFLCSRKYRELKPIHSRWYRWEYDPKKGKERYIKYVPEDVELCPLTLYNWYIGDGWKCKKSVAFSTQGFSNCCREILKDKLQKIGIKSTIWKDGTTYIATHSALLSVLALIQNININGDL